MSPRHHAGLSARTLVASSGVLAIVGVSLLAMASQHSTPTTLVPQLHVTAPAATPRPPHVATSAAPAPVAPSATRTTGAPASELPPPDSGPAGDPAIQRALDAATPEDLPAQTAATLVDLGRRVWTAEATGTGRQRWPGYFGAPSGGASWTYSRFRIQAAIARRDASSPGRAVVRLVWAGADPAGQFLDDRTATVTFTRQGQTWTPVR